MTEKTLQDAFAGESQADRRYLYFASKADVEGYNDVSSVFRSTRPMDKLRRSDLYSLEAYADARRGAAIEAGVSHANYTATTHLGSAARRALAADLDE